MICVLALSYHHCHQCIPQHSSLRASRSHRAEPVQGGGYPALARQSQTCEESIHISTHNLLRKKSRCAGFSDTGARLIIIPDIRLTAPARTSTVAVVESTADAVYLRRWNCVESTCLLCVLSGSIPCASARPACAQHDCPRQIRKHSLGHDWLFLSLTC